WLLKAGDILPYFALIPGFAGWGAANRAYLDIKFFGAASTLFEERSELIAQICHVAKLDHPYMDYFQEDWALLTIIWSVVWHGRYIRRSTRVAHARGVRVESVDV
ncbi:hypothetical protein PENSPDRAFT_671544, partial [Peniophora sp. CONT]